MASERSYLLCNSVKIDISRNKDNDQEITREELKYYSARPVWRKIRFCLFWIFWAMLIIILCASIIIAVTFHREIQSRDTIQHEIASTTKLQERLEVE